jgi:hypothetical protein
MLAAVVAAALSLPTLIAAQIHDTLAVGDRVRVRVGEARGYTNEFIGRVGALSPDTLMLEIPRGQGRLIFPRSAISEVAVASGRESRWTNVGMAVPLVVPPVMLATLPTPPGSHATSFRNRKFVMAAALLAVPITAVLSHRPREHWEPVYRWLDAK